MIRSNAFLSRVVVASIAGVLLLGVASCSKKDDAKENASQGSQGSGGGGGSPGSHGPADQPAQPGTTTPTPPGPQPGQPGPETAVQDEPEPAPTVVPRTQFISTTQLDVYEVVTGPTGRLTAVRLGSAAAGPPKAGETISVPGDGSWFVAPNKKDALRPDEVAALLAEVARKAIPGLSLAGRKEITDANLAQFKSAGLTKLRSLRLGGTSITDAGLAELQNLPPVGIVTKTMTATATRSSELKASANTQYSMGFTVFFVLMVALSGAGGIIEERELGTLRRLLASPSSRGQIIGGKVLGVASIASFEAAVLVGFGALVFGVPWGNSPAAVVLTLGALVLASTGLGIMLSTLTKTRGQLGALVPVVSTAMAMIGGCYWPIEITPPFMQTLAKFTPTGWAMVALKNTVSRGMGVASVIVPVAVLLVMAAVFFVVGLTRLKLE